MPKLPANWTPVFGPTTSVNNTTNQTKVDNSDQARYERAKASGNKVLENNLAKKLGISTNTSTPTESTNTNTDPYANLTADQKEFDTGWNQYTEAQKAAMDIETSRWVQQYTQQMDDIRKTMDRNRADYARYTSDAQTQMNRQLALNNKDFARKLANAASAYGQRGILRSWVAKNQLGEVTNDFADNQTYFKTQSQRQITDNQAKYDQQYADLSTDAGRIDTGKMQYMDDRNIAKQVLDTQMKYQGDTMYNQFQAQQWATQQEANRQAVTRQRTGTATDPSLRTWRIGGNYTR